MHVQRLERMREILQHLDPALLNMADWTNDDGLVTTCCAVGWAMHDPWMQAQGLDNSGYYAAPRVGEKEGYVAVSEFFDISKEHTLYLFDPGEYAVAWRRIRPAHVIDRINRILEGYDPKPV